MHFNYINGEVIAVFSREEMLRLYKMAVEHVKDGDPFPATVGEILGAIDCEIFRV